MPAQLGTVIAGQAAAGVKDGVKARVEDGVKEELRGAITPGKAKKTGFIVGTAVWVTVGHGWASFRGGGSSRSSRRVLMTVATRARRRARSRRDASMPAVRIRRPS